VIANERGDPLESPRADPLYSKGHPMRLLHQLGGLALVLTLTCVAATHAQVVGGVGYNPYTGNGGRAAAGYNPYTGRDVAGQNSYNAYTGTHEQSRSAYNPYTGSSASVQRAYNPYTGRSAYHYSYQRR
jgi:hypothetical protein